jgi:hypothetical protein
MTTKKHTLIWSNGMSWEYGVRLDLEYGVRLDLEYGVRLDLIKDLTY